MVSTQIHYCLFFYSGKEDKTKICSETKMFALSPLVNSCFIIPRLHLLNESTDLNITKGFSVLFLQLQTIFDVHVLYLKYFLTCCIQRFRLKDVVLFYKDWVQHV